MGQTGKIDASSLLGALTELYKNKDSLSKVNDESFKTAFDEANADKDGVSVDELLKQMEKDTGISIDDFSSDEQKAINETLNALSDGSDKYFEDYQDLMDISQEFYDNLESSKALETLNYSISNDGKNVTLSTVSASQEQQSQEASSPASTTSDTSASDDSGKKHTYNDGSYVILSGESGSYKVSLYTKDGTLVKTRDIADGDYENFGIENPNQQAESSSNGSQPSSGSGGAQNNPSESSNGTQQTGSGETQNTQAAPATPDVVACEGSESTVDNNALFEANDDDTIEDFECTDGKDDGKLGFFAAAGELVKGVGQGIVNLGKNFVKSGGPAKVAVGLIGCKVGAAAITAACAAAGIAAAPVLAVAGTALAAVGLIYFGPKAFSAASNFCKNLGKAWDADSDAEAKYYYNTAGNDSVEAVANGVGAWFSYKAIKNNIGNCMKGIKSLGSKIKSKFTSSSSSTSSQTSAQGQNTAQTQGKQSIFKKAFSKIKSKITGSKAQTPQSSANQPATQATTTPAQSGTSQSATPQTTTPPATPQATTAPTQSGSTQAATPKATTTPAQSGTSQPAAPKTSTPPAQSSGSQPTPQATTTPAATPKATTAPSQSGSNQAATPQNTTPSATPQATTTPAAAPKTSATPQTTTTPATPQATTAPAQSSANQPATQATTTPAQSGTSQSAKGRSRARRSTASGTRKSGSNTQSSSTTGTEKQNNSLIKFAKDKLGRFF